MSDIISEEEDEDEATEATAGGEGIFVTSRGFLHRKIFAIRWRKIAT